jgi:hypothetical protein
LPLASSRRILVAEVGGDASGPSTNMGVETMRLSWQTRREEPVDPHRPHAHRAKTDPGIAALSPLGGSVGRQEARLASAGAYTRTLGCAVPGCGKPSDDLIHAPQDA